MSKQQILDDLKTNIQESIDSIKAIKGEPYANAVSFLHLAANTNRLMVILTQEASMESRLMLVKQYAAMVQLGMGMIADAYGMSDETVQEITDWAKQLDKRTGDAMDQINREMNK